VLLAWWEWKCGIVCRTQRFHWQQIWELYNAKSLVIVSSNRNAFTVLKGPIYIS
jgi:hypothetical protein